MGKECHPEKRGVTGQKRNYGLEGRMTEGNSKITLRTEGSRSCQLHTSRKGKGGEAMDLRADPNSTALKGGPDGPLP